MGMTSSKKNILVLFIFWFIFIINYYKITIYQLMKCFIIRTWLNRLGYYFTDWKLALLVYPSLTMTLQVHTFRTAYSPSAMDILWKCFVLQMSHFPETTYGLRSRKSWVPTYWPNPSLAHKSDLIVYIFTLLHLAWSRNFVIALD